MVSLADLSCDIKQSCFHGDTPLAQHRTEGTVHSHVHVYTYMYVCTCSVIIGNQLPCNGS